MQLSQAPFGMYACYGFIEALQAGGVFDRQEKKRMARLQAELKEVQGGGTLAGGESTSFAGTTDTQQQQQIYVVYFTIIFHVPKSLIFKLPISPSSKIAIQETSTHAI
jgi:hypothetical protein